MVRGGSGGGGESSGSSFEPYEVDLEGIWELAGEYADNEINPQLEAIDQALRDAGYTADESQRAISEAYPLARRSLQKSIYENFVAGEQGLAAMGTGRGGARAELMARAWEREAIGVEGIETQRSREMGAIQRSLSKCKTPIWLHRKQTLKGSVDDCRTSIQKI